MEAADGEATGELREGAAETEEGAFVTTTIEDDSLAMLEERVANMSVVVEGSAGAVGMPELSAGSEGDGIVPMEKTSDWQ